MRKILLCLLGLMVWSANTYADEFGVQETVSWDNDDPVEPVSENAHVMIQTESLPVDTVKTEPEFVDTTTFESQPIDSVPSEITFTPGTGRLKLNPSMDSSLPGVKQLKAVVNGVEINVPEIDLQPGYYNVLLIHQCYEPVDFSAEIVENAEYVFDQALVRGYGDLDLKAEYGGMGQTLPVYVDGNYAGNTPFLGKVPLCSKITLRVSEKNEPVDVDLKRNELVQFTYTLKENPNGVVANKVEDDFWNEDRSQTSQSSNSTLRIPWLRIGISAAVIAAGTVLAVVANNQAKTAFDNGFSDKAGYDSSRKKAKTAQTLRTVGFGIAIAGGVGLGLSFVF